MEATGCATGVAICACSPVRHRRDRPQVLPAYGLQDLRNKSRNLKTKSNANTTCLQNTLGEDHGSGHFYLAENRTFLLCVDTQTGSRRKHEANRNNACRMDWNGYLKSRMGQSRRE